MHGDQPIRIHWMGSFNQQIVHYQGFMDFKFTDTKINDNLFRRVINKDTLYIQNGEIILKEKQLPAKAFKVGKVENKISELNSFCTFDIETVSINNVQSPYLICAYYGDFMGGNYIHSFASDLSEVSQEAMFNSFIKQLVDLKNIKYAYAHNLSGFDGILLLKYLIAYEGANVKPLIFNGKLMAIRFKLNDRIIIFKDSFLLLPQSLRKLCASFNVPTIKTHFPFLLTDINYNGHFPDYNLFNDLSRAEYDQLEDNFYANSKTWNFKEEALAYCKIDCKSLFQVLCRFNELVYSEFKVNINASYTLPSLAMRIYKTPPKKLVRIISNS